MPSSRKRSGRGAAGRSSRQHIKTLQLCRQVQRTLQLALGCRAEEELQGLEVLSVEPAPNASQLLVRLAPLLPSDVRPVENVWSQLGPATGALRTEVAAAIRRRRAPQLLFQIEPQMAAPEVRPRGAR